MKIVRAVDIDLYTVNGVQCIMYRVECSAVWGSSMSHLPDSKDLSAPQYFGKYLQNLINSNMLENIHFSTKYKKHLRKTAQFCVDSHRL